MKARWIRLARRLNSLSVRERVIMAVSLAAALAAVVHTSLTRCAAIARSSKP